MNITPTVLVLRVTGFLACDIVYLNITLLEPIFASKHLRTCQGARALARHGELLYSGLFFLAFLKLFLDNFTSVIVFTGVHDDFFELLQREDLYFAFVELVVVCGDIVDDTSFLEFEFTDRGHIVHNIVLFLQSFGRHLL